MELLVPVPKPTRTRLAPAARPEDLSGKRVGFIDNGWWSTGVMFTVIEEYLKRELDVAQVIRVRKDKSIPTERAVLEDLALRCGAVITALGN